jgi:hypothetical protein
LLPPLCIWRMKKTQKPMIEEERAPTSRGSSPTG